MQNVRVLVVDDSPSILRVVEGVLSGAGYTVDTATTGEAALDLARAATPDLMLLDFMMPKMNGYQVCKAMKEDDRLRGIPVVLMCTKGDGAAERFIAQMGVVDHITKPFSPDAILALTSYTLEKHQANAYTSDPALAQLPAEERTLVQPYPSPPETTAQSPMPVAQAAEWSPQDALAQALTRSLGERMLENPGTNPAAWVGEAVAEALAQLPPSLWVAQDLLQTRPSLWGDFSQVPIPEVFQLLTLQGQTGLFQVWTRPTVPGAGEVRFDVYFSQGKLDFVHAVNMAEDFLLGRFLVARGAIDKAELDSLLRARKSRGGKLLGQQMVALGHITREQLKDALRDQCCELIYEVLRVPQGTFCLRKGVAPSQPEQADARLAIPVSEILLEGLRRVDEWGMIEKHIGNFDVTFEPDRKDPAARLTEEERYVLSQVGPGLNVRHIIGRTGMRPFHVCKILYRLVVARHIRPVA